MNRIVLWLLSTLSVLVLLFGYHTSTSGAGLTASPPGVFSGSSQTSGNGGSSGASQKSSGQKSSGQKAPAATAPTSATGAVAQTQWGPVQVKISVASGAITDVNVLQYPSGNGTDAQINSYALPQLIQETLNQQSANIQMISGATVTSTGYLQSLQSAIDQAGL